MGVNITVQSKELCNSGESHRGGILEGMFCAGPFEGKIKQLKISLFHIHFFII